MNDRPLVSVLVPTRNSAQYVRACLESILKQTYSHIELIVIDNFSTDETCAIARSCGATVYQVGPERCAQLNHGAAKAQGKYLYRVDSDFVLEPGVIDECVRLCEEEQFDNVAVPNLSAGDGFWARVRKLERDTYVGDTLIVAVRFFRRDAFFAVRGFDQEMVAAEDYDLHNRLIQAGYKWTECKYVEKHLGEPRSLREIASKSYYYGTTIGLYLKKHPQRAAGQMNPFRPSYFRHWRSFVRQPALSTGFVIMKLSQYSCGAVGLGMALIRGNFA